MAAFLAQRSKFDYDYATRSFKGGFIVSQVNFVESDEGEKEEKEEKEDKAKPMAESSPSSLCVDMKSNRPSSQLVDNDDEECVERQLGVGGIQRRRGAVRHQKVGRH